MSTRWSKILLFSSHYDGGGDTGGNRTHAAIRRAFAALDEPLEIRTIALGSDSLTSATTIHANGLVQLARLGMRDRYSGDRVDRPALTVLDGFPAMIYATAAGIQFNFAIHHNIEWRLFSSRIKKLLARQVQLRVAKAASENVVFSNIDKMTLSDAGASSLAVLPLTREEAELRYRTAFKATSQVASCGNAVIPSNLGYFANVEGLELFYRKYRANYSGSILITSPVGVPVPERMEHLMVEAGDRMYRAESFEEYFALLSSAECVILPVFNGSGIQIKAIDALFSGRPVFASELIRRSHPAFSAFGSIEDGTPLRQLVGSIKAKALDPAATLDRVVEAVRQEFMAGRLQ